MPGTTLAARHRSTTVVGQRKNGRSAGPFLIAGPSWSGPAPSGLTLLKSPTAVNWSSRGTRPAAPRTSRPSTGSKTARG
ncbi:DUF1254 domain-containing protein [Streptomyces flavochromogenes]|uniref:DUF1254 domain-containing protein n=1 Tax=Streptomyces flavochromogenes TaxID=68199 RepID=UPI001FD853E5|nr:DUF1254 domain-containing protein [Streptomyces flavochromogenes]